MEKIQSRRNDMVWDCVSIAFLILIVISIPFFTVTILKHNGKIKVSWRFYKVFGESCIVNNDMMFLPVEFTVANAEKLDYIFSNIRLELFDNNKVIGRFLETEKPVIKGELFIKNIIPHCNYLVEAHSSISVKRVFAISQSECRCKNLKVHYSYNDIHGKKITVFMCEIGDLVECK